MRIIIAGSSTWENSSSIRAVLESYPDSTTVVHGDSPGADEIGGQVAEDLGMKVEPMSKIQDDYRRYRRGAWKALNERMIEKGADLILAFHPDIEKSRGTKHLLKLADSAGIPYEIIAE